MIIEEKEYRLLFRRKENYYMRKWIVLLLSLCILFAMTACTEENIVEDLEGPEGIELFAGIWYYENKDLWIEIYYDGAWCSFEDGGMLRSYGTATITGEVGNLSPTEGADSFLLSAKSGLLADDLGNTLFRVTEVGVRKPLIVNNLGIPDILPEKTEVVGTVDLTMAKEYAGFYISEDGIFALELFPDGTYELLEYGLLVESGSFLRLTEPNYGEVYAVDLDMQKYRLVIAQEERLYLGDCGIFAPGEKAAPLDE